MKRNLQTVAALAAASPFSENSLRWFVFNAATNGLADCDAIVRVGRRVYLDVDQFEVWIEAQQHRAMAVA